MKRKHDIRGYYLHADMLRKIDVAGLGYVGVTVAALFADVPGFNVVSIQRRPKRPGWETDWFNAGKNALRGGEPELSELLALVLEKVHSRLLVTCLSARMQKRFCSMFKLLLMPQPRPF